MHTEQQGIVVAVSPASALAARPRLFAALEAAFPVSFVALGRRRAAGGRRRRCIAFAHGRAPAGPRGPGAAPGSRFSRCTATETRTAGAEDFRLRSTPGVDARLRDVVLSGRLSARGARPRRRRGPGRRGLRPGLDGVGGPGARAPRARRAGRARRRRAPLRAALRARAGRGRPHPLPARRLGARRLAPAAAAGDDALRRPEPALAQLRLHQLRRAARARRRARLPRRHGDDPARRRAAPNRAAAALFRERPDRLSLVFHGNDHIKGELMAPKDVADATAVAAQALRRVERFERRSAPARRPRHDAAARDVLRAHDARSRRAGLRRAGGHLPAAVDRSLPVGPAAGRLAPGGLGRRLRRHPAHPAELERRRHRAARLPRPPGRALRPPRGRRRGPRAAGDGRGGGQPPGRRAAGCRWARSRPATASAGWPATAPSCGRTRAACASRPSRARAPCACRRRPTRWTAARWRAGRSATARCSPSATDVPWQGNGHVEIRLRGAQDLDASDVAAPAWRPWPKLRRAATEARDRLCRCAPERSAAPAVPRHNDDAGPQRRRGPDDDEGPQRRSDRPQGGRSHRKDLAGVSPRGARRPPRSARRPWAFARATSAGAGTARPSGWCRHRGEWVRPRLRSARARRLAASRGRCRRS